MIFNAILDRLSTQKRGILGQIFNSIAIYIYISLLSELLFLVLKIHYSYICNDCDYDEYYYGQDDTRNDDSQYYFHWSYCLPSSSCLLLLPLFLFPLKQFGDFLLTVQFSYSAAFFFIFTCCQAVHVLFCLFSVLYIFVAFLRVISLVCPVVVCCLLFVDCCLLFAVRCRQSAVGCLLSVVCCLLFLLLLLLLFSFITMTHKNICCREPFQGDLPAKQTLHVDPHPHSTNNAQNLFVLLVLCPYVVERTIQLFKELATTIMLSSRHSLPNSHLSSIRSQILGFQDSIPVVLEELLANNIH